MEFDKNKILTVATADQFREGQLGWTNDRVNWLKKDVETIPPYLVETPADGYYSTEFPFYDSKSCCHRRYFYPAPEPTYAERQAEWVKENNVKAGTKVRVTRTFTSYEDGCNEVFVPLKGTFIGDDCTVDVIHDTCIIVRSKQKDDWWRFPYFALEVVNEPTYAERQAEWVKENNVKGGTKVRVTRTFTEDEDGSCCWEHHDLVGMTGVVSEHGILSHNLGVNMSDGNVRAIPYFALEVIKEPTYAERQEEWIRKHNLKEGDKVLILKKASSQENGWPNSWTVSMDSKVGNVFTYVRTSGNGIRLSCGYEWPYFVLEVVKEPTYRPYSSEELNYIVGNILVRKSDGSNVLVNERNSPIKVRLGDGCMYTAEQLLELFTLNDEPCGVKV